MYDFREIKMDELSELILGRIPFEIFVPATITKFKEEIPGVNFSEPREVPPTAVILTKEGIAQVLAYCGDTRNGMFTQFVVLVYALNGKINYLETADSSYLAKVTWPDLGGNKTGT